MKWQRSWKSTARFFWEVSAPTFSRIWLPILFLWVVVDYSEFDLLSVIYVVSIREENKFRRASKFWPWLWLLTASLYHSCVSDTFIFRHGQFFDSFTNFYCLITFYIMVKRGHEAQLVTYYPDIVLELFGWVLYIFKSTLSNMVFHYLLLTQSSLDA